MPIHLYQLSTNDAKFIRVFNKKKYRQARKGEGEGDVKPSRFWLHTARAGRERLPSRPSPSPCLSCLQSSNETRYSSTHSPRSLWYNAFTSGSPWYLMLLSMVFRTDLLSWKRMSVFPRTWVRMRPDLVRTGAPFPERPKDRASWKKTG